LNGVPRSAPPPGAGTARTRSGCLHGRPAAARAPGPVTDGTAVKPVVRTGMLIGYRVDGRHGRLGTVIDAEGEERETEQSEILVRGGASDALYYHVPSAAVVDVSLERRTVTLDLDVVDFTPRLRDDGSVDLYLVQD